MINNILKTKFLILLLVITGPNICFSGNNSDSLWQVWQRKDLDDSIRLNAFSLYIQEQYMYNSPDTALYYSKMLYSAARIKESAFHMAEALNKQGSIHCFIGEYNESIILFEEAQTLNTEIGNEEGVAVNLSNIALAFSRKGDFDKAVNYYFDAIKILENKKDSLKLAKAYNNLAELYYNQEYNDMASEYFTKSLGIYKLLDGVEVDLGISYMNIGSTKADIEEQQFYYSLALKKFKKENFKPGLPVVYINMANNYETTNETEKALEYYLNAKRILEELDDKSNLAYVLCSIGDLLFKEKRYAEAEKYLLEGFEIANKIDVVKFKKLSSESLYKLYSIRSEYKKALHYHEIYSAMKDSLNLTDNEYTLKMKYKHEYEKQALIDSLEFVKKAELHDLEVSEREAQLQKSKIQKFGLIVGLLLMGILGINLSKSYNRKKRDHELISKQHQELSLTHHEIKESIDYSKRLQDAILPSESELSEFFRNHFVFNKPKDVVSGDFYWFEQIKNEEVRVLAVADCTGHGVPGAMVSVVCSNALNRSVNEFGCTKPAEILNKTRELVIETFAKSGQGVRDGMDITICCINGSELSFAMANNPLWLVRKANECEGLKASVTHNDLSLFEFKSCRQSVSWSEVMTPFKEYKINLEPNDCIYLMSDGYADQFGGASSKKFKKKTLKYYLLEINSLSMGEQGKELKNKFLSWKGALEQVDDICLLGIKF